MTDGMLLGGRYESRDSVDHVLGARDIVFKQLLIWQEQPDEGALWLEGIDRETQQPVLISPRSRHPWEWSGELVSEAAARAVAAMRSPWIVPLLHVGPGIVYAVPPPSRPYPTLPLRDAARCAVQACEVLAGLHALGVCPSFGTRSLRLTQDADGWRIAWLVPSLDALVLIDRVHERLAGTEDDEVEEHLAPGMFVRRDVQQVVRFLTALLGGTQVDIPACASAAELARILAPWTESPDVAAAIDAWPVVTQPRRRAIDWDAVIAESEAHARNEYIDLALASAYHQRACRSFAAGDRDAALADVERALARDPAIDYRTTRAVILDRLARRKEARREVKATLAAAAKHEPVRRDKDGVIIGRNPPLDPAQHARAHATAGLFAMHDGDVAAAQHALRAAVALHPAAASCHALGAALYALDDVAGAAEWEARAVELDPHDSRFRWALVVSLRRLGRHAEAIEHARALLRDEPDDPAHRARFARLFD